MTFVSADDLWVEASMTENQLGHVEPGDKVELTFDALPGRVFQGKVKSSAVGVSTGKVTNLADLATAEKRKGWLRDPQRFPVIIQLTDYDIDINRATGIRVNSQADVIIYTGGNPVWNLLGKGWIRLMSWLSYAF
jgi:multidrug resistance efflux pump